MKKGLKSLVVLISAISVLSLVTPISCSATTKGDVIAVARKVGMPESLVQSYISMGANIEVTSEQCDKAIAKLYEIYGTTNDKINKDFDVDIPDEPNEPKVTESSVTTTVTSKEPNTSQDTQQSDITKITTTDTKSQGNNVQTQPQQSVITNANTIINSDSIPNDTSVTDSNYVSPIDENEFISMSYDEKIEFVNSLPQEEKTQFMSNLTTAERNSIIKQMSLDNKTEIVNSIVEAGKSMGYNFSVDELSGDNISLSMRDNEGTLIGVTKFGTNVDDTGKNYTNLVLSMIAIIGISGYGLFKISKKVG